MNYVKNEYDFRIQHKKLNQEVYFQQKIRTKIFTFQLRRPKTPPCPPISVLSFMSKDVGYSSKHHIKNMAQETNFSQRNDRFTNLTHGEKMNVPTLICISGSEIFEFGKSQDCMRKYI